MPKIKEEKIRYVCDSCGIEIKDYTGNSREKTLVQYTHNCYVKVTVQYAKDGCLSFGESVLCNSCIWEGMKLIIEDMGR